MQNFNPQIYQTLFVARKWAFLNFCLVFGIYGGAL